MNFLVPEHLETERLLLRQFREDDWRDLHQYYSSPLATKFTVGREYTEGETWRTLSGMLGHWYLRGYGPYAVQDKSNGSVLGTVGFWYPNDWPNPEINWSLAPAYWGKGYASEATRAVQKAACIHIPGITLFSFIHPDNSASLQLATAVGATFVKEILLRGVNYQMYQHSGKK